MKAIIYGVQAVDIPARGSDAAVRGVKIHYGYKDPYVIGHKVEAQMVNDNLNIGTMFDLAPGDEVNLDLNPKGKIIDVALIGHVDLPE